MNLNFLLDLFFFFFLKKKNNNSKPLSDALGFPNAIFLERFVLKKSCFSAFSAEILNF